MKLPTQEIRKARIEIIPMIDTIFFLLVFFMITSLTMVKMKAMPISLPRAATAKQAESSGAAGRLHTLILTVTDNNNYYVNKTRIKPDTLGVALQARIAADPQAVVVFNLSKNQTTQTLIKVMDTVNKLKTPAGGDVRALIATEPIDRNGRALGGNPPPQ